MDNYHKLPRIYLKGIDFIEGSKLSLDKSHAHYLFKVMRRKENDKILVFNEKSGEFLAIISDNRDIYLEKQVKAPVIDSELILVFSPIKNVDTSFVIQKATELGVTKIIPVRFRRTVVNKVNLDKLSAVAIEAAEQSERLSVPEISDIIPFTKFDFNSFSDFNIIIALERSLESKLSKVKLEFDKTMIIIGPEGGFADEEIVFLPKSVYKISLGTRILRAETAIIAALSIYQEIHE